MAEIMRGVKAGAVAGFIEGVISAIVYAAMFQILFGDIINNPPPPLTSEVYSQILYASVVYMAPIGGIISGIIVGAIFALVYSYLPTDNPIVKSVVLGVIFWLIGIVTSMGLVNITYFVINFVLGVIVFGYLLGFFWIKFGPKE